MHTRLNGKGWKMKEELIDKQRKQSLEEKKKRKEKD